MTSYCLSVIELDRAVLQRRKFVAANPDHDPRKPCVYVGMTSQSPEARFEQHKAGYKCCGLARDFGVRLRPKLGFVGLGREDAQTHEKALAERLRRKGYVTSTAVRPGDRLARTLIVPAQLLMAISKQ